MYVGGTTVLLSVNAGSSSLKVAMYDRVDLSGPVASFALENIASMESAVETLKEQLFQALSETGQTIEAIGHRVVHGGPEYAAATYVTPSLIQALERIIPLAPNHMPHTLTALRSFQDAYPDVPQVACFDTSFFHDVPPVAQVLPIPLSLQKQLGMRRYGFHGLAYQYLLHSFAQHEGSVAAKGRVIMAHLGSGASVAACKDGQPLDMSMGFTPVSGVMMSTRTGDLEPGVIRYLQQEHGMSIDELTHLVAYESGLLGVSGITADMEQLLKLQHESPDAALAIELFCSRIQKTIGGFMAVLGGVDSIIFSGGIGERSAEIRARICAVLEYAGVSIDPQRNANGDRCISSEASSVGVHVIPAQEDHSIIMQTKAVIEKEPS